ncbi:MAG: hypothetical protein JW797_09655 [Bradymonadales bacterium]|nr:hypothetical protein [Bradymonadales bacterium]
MRRQLTGTGFPPAIGAARLSVGVRPERTALVWLLFLLVGLWPAAVWGQGQTVLPTALPAAAMQGESPIGSPSQSLPGLNALWRGLLQSPDGSQAEEQGFASLDVSRTELGLPNLGYFAEVLLREADRAREAGQGERADRLIQWALTLAPEDPAPRFARAAIPWWSRPWRIPTAISDVVRGHRLAMRSPNGAMVFGFHAGRLVLAGWIGLIAVFLVIQLYRYFKLAAHDLDSWLDHHVDPSLVRLLLMLVVALPALLFLSPLLLIPLAICLVWLYQNRSERVISLVILVSFGLSPLLVQQMGRSVASAGSDAPFLYRAENDLCDIRCQSRLDELVAQQPEDKQLAFSRALVHYRLATEIDLQHAWELLSAHQFPPEIAPAAHLLKGNLLVLGGERTAAGQEYQRAIDHPARWRSLLAAAHFNLYRILAEQGDPAHEQHLAIAQDLDYQGVVQLIQGGAPRVHRYLMHVGTPFDLLIARAQKQGARLADTATGEIWRPLAGSLPMAGAFLLAAFTLLLVLAGAVWRKRRHLSRLCPRCRGIISFHDAPRAAVAGYCQDCYELFMEGTMLESQRRASLERRLDLRRTISRWLTIGGNIVLAGSGYLVHGSALAGTAILALATSGIALWVVRPTTTALPFCWEQGGQNGQILLALLLLSTAYLISWTTTWVKRQSL